MEDAIVTKLRRELSSRGPLTEARVVYILAEIRKLMERKRQQKKYYALSFHCSWALHPTMDRGGAGRILRRFDKAFELLKDKRLHELPANLRDEINATIGLEKFQDELKTFLVAHQFPTRIVEKEWTKFLRQYAAVIEDCALTLRDKSLGLQYIKKVTVCGAQEPSAYNGYFGSVCYHPLFLFNRQGDCLAAKLRPGNVRGADGWEELLLPEIERQQQAGNEVTAVCPHANTRFFDGTRSRDTWRYRIKGMWNKGCETDLRIVDT